MDDIKNDILKKLSLNNEIIYDFDKNNCDIVKNDVINSYCNMNNTYCNTNKTKQIVVNENCIIKVLENMNNILKDILENEINVNSFSDLEKKTSLINEKFNNYLNENKFEIVNVFDQKKNNDDKKIYRCAYNFCNKFPFCKSYFKWILKKKEEVEYCNLDHITLNKLQVDINNTCRFLKFLNEKNDESYINSIKTSMNTLKYVIQEHIKKLSMLNNLIKWDEKIFYDDITLHKIIELSVRNNKKKI